MRAAHLLVLAGIPLAPAIAWSQTIHGVVLDNDTRDPIVGALVELVGPEGDHVARAHTDSVGAFLVSSDRAGDYVVRVTHLAYAAVTSDTLALGPGERLGVEVRMAQTALPLEPLVVTARGRARTHGFYDRVRSGFGRYLTRADIERRYGFKATEVLRGVPGVTIVPAGLGSAAGPNLIAMRGGAGRCAATVYVDGMLMPQHHGVSVDDFLTAEMLEGVEIYTAAPFAPSPIHSVNGCGVVAFWTRNEGGGKWSWAKVLGSVAGFLLLITLTR